MKKIITIIAMSIGCAVAVQAQGTVTFATTAAAATKVNTNSVVGGPAAGLASAASGSYYYALFYSTTGATTANGGSSAIVGQGNYAFNDTSWTFVASGTNGAAGKFSTSSAQNSDFTVTIPTIAAASTAELIAIGWSSNIGSTWQDLQAYLSNPNAVGWVGQSAIASIVLGNAPGSGGSQTPISLFGTGAGQVGGLVLGEVVPSPEPGTLALAGLGIASLLALRRKK